MGLLSTEVITTLVGGNVLYYKNLGYEIPTKIDKYGKQKFDLNHKISVDVNHLKPGSNVKVRVCCDCCDKKYEIAYGDYIKNNREGKIIIVIILYLLKKSVKMEDIIQNIQNL